MANTRLRKSRKSAYLAQREVAMLVGYGSQRAHAEVELGTKRPALGPAIAFLVLFDLPLRDLFPELVENIERNVLGCARKLHNELDQDLRRKATTAFLAAVISRLSELHPTE